MEIESLRTYCLSLKAVEEKLPFGDDTLAFSVGRKIFCLTSLDSFERINLKAKPEDVITLCETYPDIGPGFHMNKKHWISIQMPGSIPDQQIFQWITDSYQLVYQGLTKKLRLEVDESE